MPGDAEFDAETVNGQPLVDWVTRLIERDPVNDVHCTGRARGEQQDGSCQPEG